MEGNVSVDSVEVRPLDAQGDLSCVAFAAHLHSTPWESSDFAPAKQLQHTPPAHAHDLQLRRISSSKTAKGPGELLTAKSGKSQEDGLVVWL